ncbi:hypothetical protein TM_0002 [Thermotoga maritima MSB8]|uniref:Uncharacterized protein n=1 Tax=Thermotoga maritima (strain ATCC 43589 / DSM 3109 / JCM 10099 / NBRC 100826 / MSB8) TaxID=243274 RepID=Q9WXL7_THEMA|nr:hypothetical protein TM_0002 [Thermotoga maritima MSB8]
MSPEDWKRLICFHTSKEVLKQTLDDAQQNISDSVSIPLRKY